MQFLSLLLLTAIALYAQGSSCQRHGNNVGKTSLVQAIKMNKPKLVKNVLKQQDPNQKDPSGYSPLHWACYAHSHASQVEMITLLLQAGADINVQDPEGWTPLHWVLKTNPQPIKDQDVLSTLLAYKPNIHLKNNNAQTPLHYAIFYNHTHEHIEQLLNHGGDCTIQDIDGRTVLHYAVIHYKYDKDKIIPLLLAHKADPNLQDKLGKTPLEYAKENKDEVALRCFGVNLTESKESSEDLK